ncbi:MAG: Hpt domain-containing protein [Planctomycetes bacterium]|nr:Hpt domain-containing protein [Planctomycetota bacterium]
MDNVLDMSVVEELLSFADDGDPELLVDLIQMFLEDGPSKVKAITEGLEEGDMEKVERAAHSLKGSSGNLGARHLQDSCEKMQIASRQHQVEQVREITPEIVSTYADAEVALRALLAGYTA